MNKYKLLSLLILVLFFSLSSAQTDLERLFKSGTFQNSPVKSYTEIITDVKDEFGELVFENERKSKETQYNNLGYVTFNATIGTYFEFYYRIKYDEQGRKIESIDYDSDGEIEGVNKHRYDTQGNIIETSDYNPEGDLESVSKNTYDAQGNMIERTVYDPDGSLSYVTRNQYDAQGNAIEYFYKSEYSDRTTRYTFNNQGQRIGYSSFDGSSLESQMKITYDTLGNIIENIRYDSDGNVEYKAVCDYSEYDGFSNWTKRICVKAVEKFGELRADYTIDDDEMTRRIIEYY